MRLIDRVKGVLLDFKYAKILQIIAVYFALAYHICFFVTFGVLKIYPLFFYNIYSVLLFSILGYFVFTKRSFVVQFFFLYTEVVVHQILADYYLGGMASFHFFIFLTGILPLLTFRQNFKLAAFYGILSVVLFTILEVMAPYITPQYELSERALIIIKTVNISINSIVNITGLLMYSYIVFLVEGNLEQQVEVKTAEVTKKTEKLLKIQSYVINSLANLVDNRDVYTGEHIQRTSAYAEMIALSAIEKGIYPDQITPEFAEYIKRAAPLHDVGKIVVSDVILKKPGRLTTEEFEEMKLHAKEGGRIITEVFAMSDDREFIKIASEVSSYHHEKWNGSGYPKGLRQEDIPISARIMAIADVFDALVSKRCYKDPYPIETAYTMMQDASGTHFDPVLLDLFLSQKDKIEEIMHNYAK